MENENVNRKLPADLRDRFKDLTLEASKAEVQLGDKQIKRYVNRAREGLPENVRQTNPELLD
jgi:hypothetical protein